MHHFYGISCIPVFDWVRTRVGDLYSFLCSVFCFVCLCPVNYVPKVTSASGLVILDCHFGFPYGILIDGQGNVVSHFRNLVHNLIGISVIFSLNLFSF